jgi:iron-sulfur cluster repair protein YtfE (RIC family)
MGRITDFMARDHDRLDELFREFQGTKRRDLGHAKQCFREFNRGLQRHIVWEEEVLFPPFERQTGMQQEGPTAVMRAEHRRIHDVLSQIHDRIGTGDTSCDALEEQIIALLAAHNQKEEAILYPWFDRSFSEQQAEATLARMVGMASEQFTRCCE